MQPNIHSALSGNVFVDPLGKELSPTEMKSQIDSTKQGLGKRIVAAIVGIFRSDAKQVAVLKNDIVELDKLQAKIKDLEAAKGDDKLSGAAQEELDACYAKGLKLMGEIGKLWNTPSVKALYLETAVKNAVKDGNSELKELRQKMLVANSEYSKLKENRSGATTILVNNIEDLKKDIEGDHKKKEVLSRVLELEKTIEPLQTQIALIESKLQDPKFEDVAEYSTVQGDVLRLESEIQDLSDLQKTNPNDQDLKDRIKIKRDLQNKANETARNIKQDYEDKDFDIKQLHSEMNRLINELSKGKEMLKESLAERNKLADSLQAEAKINDAIDVLTEAQIKLAGLDKSKPEEMALELTKLRLNLAARQLIVQEGKVLRADERRFEFQEKMLEEREKTLADLEKKLGDVHEEYKDKIDNGLFSEQYTQLTGDLQKQIDVLRKENDKLREQLKEESPTTTKEWEKAKDTLDVTKMRLADLEKKREKMKPDEYQMMHDSYQVVVDSLESMVAKGPHEPAEAWHRQFKSAFTAESAVNDLTRALSELEEGQKNFEDTKNRLINLIEEAKTAIEAEKGKRSSEFIGDLKHIDAQSLNEIESDILSKESRLADMKQELNDLTTRPDMFDLDEPKPLPTYFQLLPAQHKAAAEELFGGLVEQIDESTAHLQELEEAVRGTPAHADVLQLLKDLKATRNEIPHDMQVILDEKAAAAKEKARSERISGEARKDVRMNKIVKNEAEILRLARENKESADKTEEMYMKLDELDLKIRDLNPDNVEVIIDKLPEGQFKTNLKALKSQIDEKEAAYQAKRKDVEELRSASAIANAQTELDSLNRDVNEDREAFENQLRAAEGLVKGPIVRERKSLEQQRDQLRVAFESENLKIGQNQERMRSLTEETARIKEELKALDKGESVEEPLI